MDGWMELRVWSSSASASDIQVMFHQQSTDVAEKARVADCMYNIADLCYSNISNVVRSVGIHEYVPIYETIYRYSRCAWLYRAHEYATV